MAQSKDTSKSPGATKPARRTRRKPRPVTIDLEATEVGQDESAAEATETDIKQASVNTDADSSPVGDGHERDSNDTNADSSSGKQRPISISSFISLNAIPYAVAALFGGVFSLLIYFWFAGLGWLPGTSGPETVRMNSEIGILRSNIEKMSDELETITGETIDGARSRLTALETGTAKISVVNALQEQVAALQSQLAEANELRATNAETTNSLLGRVNTAETTLNATTGLVEDVKRQLAETSQLLSSGGDIAQITVLTNRIDKLETILDEVTATPGTTSPAGNLQIAGLRSELNVATDALVAAQQKLQAKVTAMDSQIIALQRSSQKMAATMSNVSNEASERLQAMDNALASLEIRRNAGPVSQIERRAAMALSLAGLARAVEAGKSFKAELDTASAFAGEQTGLDVLRSHADTGIETVKSLADRFDAVANTIISADSVAAEGNLFDRFWSSLQSIVRVRPTGFVAGDTSAAIVARAESRLQAGQLGEAVEELEALSGPALVAAEDWLGQARVRRDGDAALAALNADLIASINARPEQSTDEKDANQ